MSSFLGQLKKDEPLARHTQYRIGGPARVMAIPESEADLVWLQREIRSQGLPYFFLGQGSNLLVSDSGFPGWVIKTTKVCTRMELLPTGEVYVGSSVPVVTLLRKAVELGWSGLQFLTGIPGSVGGLVFMNGGTHLGEASSALTWVRAYDIESGEWLEYSGSQLRFQYRKNLFLPKSALVVAVKFKVQCLTSNEERQRYKSEIEDLVARRKATQPVELPSCGSVFKNPAGQKAWEIVERLGLKGHRIGGAQVSEKHSNWIVNVDRAKASDVMSLIRLIKERARVQLGIELEEEVRTLGQFE